MKIKCKILDVPSGVCYVRFKKAKIDHTFDGYYSGRGEPMIFDVAKGGEIIGIELLGSKEARKPCQESVSNEKRTSKKSNRV